MDELAGTEPSDREEEIEFSSWSVCIVVVVVPLIVAKYLVLDLL